jgi:hypothetical protein
MCPFWYSRDMYECTGREGRHGGTILCPILLFNWPRNSSSPFIYLFEPLLEIKLCKAGSMTLLFFHVSIHRTIAGLW